MSKCLRCGNELSENDRCCFKCGALNPNNPLNKTTYEYLGVNDESVIPTNNNINTDYYETNSNGKIILYIVNFIIFILTALILTKIFDGGNNDYSSSLLSGFVSSFILNIYTTSFQLLLMKAGLPWWGFFIPIYNAYLMNKMVFQNGWLFLLPIIVSFLPIAGLMLHLYFIFKILYFIAGLINFIYGIAYTFNLGARFGRSGLATILFGFVIIPFTAFSKRYQYFN